MAARRASTNLFRRIAGGAIVFVAALFLFSLVAVLVFDLPETFGMGLGAVARLMLVSAGYAAVFTAVLYVGLQIGWPKERPTDNAAHAAASDAPASVAQGSSTTAVDEPADMPAAAPEGDTARKGTDVPQPQETSQPTHVRAAYPKLMTGQLVALYKQTHEQAYRDEYLRRLQFIGFTAPEAENFFMYELMTLKHDAIARLASSDYLKGSYFDLKHVVLPQPSEYYVEHQMFLCSEIVKIWDEAEWHYWNSHERDLPSEVWQEIYAISRYGGGKLFVDYLGSMAEHTGTPLEKVRAYSMAEQQLMYKYKWNVGKGERHPYER